MNRREEFEKIIPGKPKCDCMPRDFCNCGYVYYQKILDALVASDVVLQGEMLTEHEIEGEILKHFCEGKSLIKVNHITIDPIYCRELAQALLKAQKDKRGK